MLTINRCFHFLFGLLAFVSFSSANLANEFASKDIQSSENADSLRMIFPENTAYSTRELTYFKWESSLDTTYDYRLIIYRDSLRQETLIDSTYQPLLILGIDEDSIMQYVPGENRIDLIDLFAASGSYYWDLRALNPNDTIVSQGSFSLTESGETYSMSPTSIIDMYRNGNYEDIYRFEIDEHIKIKDININLVHFASDYYADYHFFDASLISPSGETIELTNSFATRNTYLHRKYFDDEAAISIKELHENRSSWVSFFYDYIDRDTTDIIDSRVKPVQQLSNFYESDAYGQWDVVIKYHDTSFLDSAAVTFDMEFEDFPSALEVESWSEEGVNLKWETASTLTDVWLEKRQTTSETYEQIAQLQGSSGTYFDAFMNPNEAFVYRITGINEQGEIVQSNDRVVKTALAPVEYNSIINGFSGYGCGDISVYKVNWVPHPTADGYLISSTGSPGRNESYRRELPNEYRCFLFAIRAIHEFDTSEVTVVRRELELVYPNSIVRQTELDSTIFTFQYESNISNNLLAKVYRLGEDGWELLFDPKPTDSNEFSIWGEELEMLRQPGRYRWSVGHILEEFSERVFYVDEVLSTTPVDPIIELWPNPADQMLTIKSPQRIDQWEILDLSGNVLMTGPGNQSKVEINLIKLTAGMYLLKTESNGQQDYHRLIKQ
jgi:hypothetical protein